MDTTIQHAREFGHETYVDWLLCSKNFLKADSGPMAMSITQSKEENMRRAAASLNIRAPVGGMVVNSGIADEATREHQQAIMEELQKRGVLIVNVAELIEGHEAEIAEVLKEFSLLYLMRLADELGEMTKSSSGNGPFQVLKGLVYEEIARRGGSGGMA